MIGALITGTVLALVAMGIVLYPLFFPAVDDPGPAGPSAGDGCEACGGRLVPRARFCPWCGAPANAGPRP